MEVVSTTIPHRDEGPMKPLKSEGETRGPNSRRHRVPLLPITVDDDKSFFHWLVSDDIPSKGPRWNLTASLEKIEWLLQSKEFRTWRTDPHSVLWLYGTGKLVALCSSGSAIVVTSH